MTQCRFKNLMRERCEFSTTGEEALLSVSEYYGVKPRRLAFVGEEFESRSDSLEGYRRVHKGDLVMNYMLAWKGAYGVSDYDGIVSPAYAVFEINTTMVNSRYLHHRLRSETARAEFKSRSKGIIDSRLRLYPDAFLALPIEVPEMEKQRAIADFLDVQTTRVDSLISKKLQQLELVSEQIESMVTGAISHPDSRHIPFKFAVEQQYRAVDLSQHAELTRLGLYNRGRGIFKKPAADEDGMGDSSFFFVRNGDLILSGQFAWEGAVALAHQSHDGCVVSHRYPVYRAAKGIRTSYLLAFLRSRLGDFLLNEASRGSAGRNRPLNTWRLGREKIPIPPIALQEAIEERLQFEAQLRRLTQDSIRLLMEQRSTVITATVSGWPSSAPSAVGLSAILEEGAA